MTKREFFIDRKRIGIASLALLWAAVGAGWVTHTGFDESVFVKGLDPDERLGVWLLRVGPEGMEVDEDFRPDFRNLPTGAAGPHDMLLK